MAAASGWYWIALLIGVLITLGYYRGAGLWGRTTGGSVSHTAYVIAVVSQIALLGALLNSWAGCSSKLLLVSLTVLMFLASGIAVGAALSESQSP